MNSFGDTELKVSRLGMGLAWIGLELTREDLPAVQSLLDFALDSGINFFDTAPTYGISEELIGRTISKRRSEFYIATKCMLHDNLYKRRLIGKLLPPSRSRLIERAFYASLKRLKTSYVDILQVHSLTIETMKNSPLLEAMLKIQEKGDARYLGYSGDNQAASWAVSTGIFQSLQTTCNLLDQKALFGLCQDAKSRGLGIIIKRPLANGIWDPLHTARKGEPHYEIYFKRAATMKDLGLDHNNPLKVAFDFIFSQSFFDTAIVGTKDFGHLKQNLEWIKNDNSDRELIEKLRNRFREIGGDWPQLS